jgi:hypothetical protein
MHKWIAAILIIGFIIGQGAFAIDEEKPLDYPIKQLYAEPTENSRLIYEIPIDVKLLDISEDANWHKVKISYNVGPFHYEYTGWAKIPIGETIVDREKEPGEIASLE